MSRDHHNWPDYAASRLAHRRRLAATIVRTTRAAEQACPPLRYANGQLAPRHGKSSLASLPDNVAVATSRRPCVDNRVWFKQATDCSCFELFDAGGKYLIMAGISFASVFETADAIGCVVVGSWANRPNGRQQHIYGLQTDIMRSVYVCDDSNAYLLHTGGGTATPHDPATGQRLTF